MSEKLTMGKGDFLAELHKKMEELPKAKIEKFYDSFWEVVTEALMQEKRISLAGNGSFEVVYKEAGTARNPKTGDSVDVPAQYVPKFKFSKGYRESFNLKKK